MIAKPSQAIVTPTTMTVHIYTRPLCIPPAPITAAEATTPQPFHRPFVAIPYLVPPKPVTCHATQAELPALHLSRDND